MNASSGTFCQGECSLTPNQDQYLRSVADYRNLQDRTKRDMDSARQFAIQRFATDLLDSIDNLDRALQTVPEASLKEAAESEASGTHAKDLRSLHSGLMMTEEILMNTLKKHGLARFDPLEGEGRKFDPNLDEATFFMKQEGKEDGDVFHTQSKGFTLNGRVIRAAKVGVVKNS
jgi:molecular chaperone GrpE